VEAQLAYARACVDRSYESWGALLTAEMEELGGGPPRPADPTRERDRKAA
jgi:hypothetical protein